MKIRVSSHGLTRCPGCQAHVQIADSAAATQCPFCGTTLGAELRRAPDGPSRLSGLASAGRSGVLAAALLGGVVACGAEPEPIPDGGTDSGSDTAADTSSDTGSDIGTSDAPTDVGAALYGVPADVMIDTAPAPDATPAPEYGVPADVEPDAADDVETEVAPDATPAPEYGVPPDAG